VAGKTGYSIGGLPAGDYFIVAVDPAFVSAWQDPKFLGTRRSRRHKAIARLGRVEERSI
jgi:hypothetical protein